MKRSKPRVFSQADFSAADRLDKIYIHLMQPKDFPLNTRDEDYLDKLRHVWGIMVGKSTQRTRIKLISAATGINERNVKELMNDAQHLFGDVLRVDAEFEKALIGERLWELYKMAKKESDYEVASKILERITKLKGYDREDGGLEPGDIQLPEVIFTANPKALTESVGEYIDHEDLDLLELEADSLSEGESED